MQNCVIFAQKSYKLKILVQNNCFICYFRSTFYYVLFNFLIINYRTKILSFTTYLLQSQELRFHKARSFF